MSHPGKLEAPLKKLPAKRLRSIRVQNSLTLLPMAFFSQLRGGGGGGSFLASTPESTVRIV